MNITRYVTLRLIIFSLIILSLIFYIIYNDSNYFESKEYYYRRLNVFYLSYFIILIIIWIIVNLTIIIDIFIHKKIRIDLIKLTKLYLITSALFVISFIIIYIIGLVVSTNNNLSLHIKLLITFLIVSALYFYEMINYFVMNKYAS